MDSDIQKVAKKFRIFFGNIGVFLGLKLQFNYFYHSICYVSYTF